MTETEVKIEDPAPKPADDKPAADQTTVTVEHDASDATIAQVADRLEVTDKEKE